MITNIDKIKLIIATHFKEAQKFSKLEQKLTFLSVDVPS